MLLQIDDRLGALLQQLAVRAGKNTEAYVSEALLEILEDREDYATAATAAKNAAPHISLEEMIRKYGLEKQL